MNFSSKRTTILVIADKERLRNLFAFAEGLSGIRVKFATTIEQGLQSTPADYPALFFIQGRMAGFSGEIIARTIRLELKERKPKIVLFIDPADGPEPGKNAFYRTLDSTLTDDRLAAEVQSIVAGSVQAAKKQAAPAKKTPAKSASRNGGEKSRSPKNRETGTQVSRQPAEAPAPSAATDTLVIGTETPAHPDETAPVLTEGNITDIADIVKIQTVDGVPAGQPPDSAVSPAENKSGISRFQEELDNLLGKSIPASGKATAPEVKPASSMPRTEFRPAHVRQAKSTGFAFPGLTKKRRIRLIALAAAVFAVIVATLVFQEKSPARKNPGIAGTKTAGNQTGTVRHVPPRAELPRTDLPSFIPKQALDMQYGKTNPGWERYRDPTTEFKVYREKTVIRALQVIDRSGHGISMQFFNSALKEIAGSSSYVVEADERKGDFIVEKGQLAINAKIIIYRKQPDAQVKAFVVDFR
jgi:CheY-like chemotaxis protein